MSEVLEILQDHAASFITTSNTCHTGDGGMILRSDRMALEHQ